MTKPGTADCRSVSVLMDCACNCAAPRTVIASGTRSRFSSLRRAVTMTSSSAEDSGCVASAWAGAVCCAQIGSTMQHRHATENMPHFLLIISPSCRSVFSILEDLLLLRRNASATLMISIDAAQPLHANNFPSSRLELRLLPLSGSYAIQVNNGLPILIHSIVSWFARIGMSRGLVPGLSLQFLEQRSRANRGDGLYRIKPPSTVISAPVT